MKTRLLSTLVLTAACTSLTVASRAAADAPYKVVNSAKVGGEGGFDYVYAEAASRRLYIPRGNRVTVFDLDTLAPVGVIADTKGVHGAAVDPVSGHGFSSSNPVVMWDSKTLATIKTIEVQGGPDGILFDPGSGNVFILSHRSPNLTAISAKDGTIAGTVDIGGAPEQAAYDGQGHLYVDMEDKDQIAVVDSKALKLTGHYDLGGKGGTPAGLALDAEHHVLFALCREPATCVILSSDDGHLITSLPIGVGTDGGAFNPATGEAFSSQRDGTLTVIKENSPTDFVVEQTVKTQVGAKTCTLDSKTNQIYLITAETAPAPAAPSGDGPPSGGKKRGGRGQMVPGSFTILVVGK